MKGLLGSGVVSIALPLGNLHEHEWDRICTIVGFPKSILPFFPGQRRASGSGSQRIPEQRTPSPQLLPLAEHRDHVSVLSGFEVKAPNNDAHVSGPWAYCRDVRYRMRVVALVSRDQRSIK